MPQGHVTVTGLILYCILFAQSLSIDSPDES